MIYIIKGEEEVFIQSKINEMIKSDNFDVIRLNGSDKDFSIDLMIDYCTNNSIFSKKTFVLVKDPSFLIKKIDDSKLEKLMSYINNPIYETELVLYTLENKFNGRLKAYKDVCKNAQVIELNSYDYKNFNLYVKQLVNFNSLDINDDAINTLSTICKRDASLLNRNIEILKNYPDKINSDAVYKLCTSSDDNISFDLVNSIVNKDIDLAITIERKMFNDNDSILSVIGLLASQLRLLYQLSYYVSIGKRKNEIIELTKCNEYRYNKSLETLNKLNCDTIINLLNQLSLLDIECKNNNTINDSSRFELFILNLLKENRYASN